MGTPKLPSIEELNTINRGKLPDMLGLIVTAVEPGRVDGKFDVTTRMIAPNGFLFAGVLLSVADVMCAYGVGTVFPDDAGGFTTVEVKCNFMSTAREGGVTCSARLLHGGRTTQVWDAELFDRTSGRRMAAFRCTQLLLYPKT